MKYFWFILSLFIAAALRAETNSAPASTTNAEPSATNAASLTATNPATHAGTVTNEAPVTEIFSDSANFDLKSRVAIYIGHVRVVDPRMKMTCDVMTATVPTNGRPDSIVAEQHVVIDAIDNEGKPVHATGDKAVYTYRVVNLVTNETVVLTGNPLPRVQRGEDWLTGETITWDRANNNFSATRFHTTFTPETKPHTNAPHTNPPPAASIDRKQSNP
jgi:lipopolysaccharide transport protein LptA